MSFTTTTRRIQYAGNGVTTAFSFPRLFYSNDHLVVTLTTAGVNTVQTILTDYTVTGAGASEGGTVTFLSAPASGTTITIERVVPLTQMLDLITDGNLPSDQIEQAFDLVMMAIQQIGNTDGVQARTLKFPDSEPSSTVTTLPSVDLRKGKILGFDSTTGDPVATNATATGLETVGTGDIEPEAVTASKVAPNAITTAKILDAAITLAKMANLATKRYLGRTSSGTGAVEALTAEQLAADLPAMVGDSGSGGTKGLVPAPSAGDAAKYLTGAGTYAAPTTSIYGRQVFTSSGTFTVPAGVTTVEFEILGAGGGGGAVSAANYRAGGGGNGGSYCRGRATVTPGSNISVTVGAGGAGGSGGAGATGGSSSFGSHATAPGGTGGSQNAVTGQGGAVTSAGSNPTGTYDYDCAGGRGFSQTNQGSISTYPALCFGGGNALFPGLFATPSNAAGTSAVNRGCGGTGACNTNGTGSLNGGNGADGLVIVRW